jgi:hypothetical protein
MSTAREAFYLPVLFLTVALLGGARIAERVVLVPPSLFSLVLAMLLLGVLVKCGALAPDRLMSAARPAIANLNGFVVIVSMFFAAAQALSLSTPESGLPHLIVSLFLLVLLLNTLAAGPDRIRLMRSLLVIFGSAFVLKFIVLAALSDPEGGRLKRVLLALLEGVTLGTMTQGVLHPSTGYLAFFTLVLFVVGLALLPGSQARHAMVTAQTTLPRTRQS